MGFAQIHETFIPEGLEEGDLLKVCMHIHACMYIYACMCRRHYEADLLNVCMHACIYVWKLDI